MEISFGSLSGLDFPNYNELGDHIQGCIDCFPDNEQAHKIFEPMLDNFSSTYHGMNIGYIKVADYNTCGMDYVPSSDPDYRKKPFYAFVRSVGVHANKSDGSGGSYGFGKAAYFLISPLRTLMVSTMTNTGRFFFEGVSALCTHTFRGETKVSVGFYDNNDGNPVNDTERIPKPFRRTEPGTNFYLMGVNLDNKEREAAVREMLEASVRNFWMCILEGNLVVSIDGNEIDKDNLDSYMTEYFPTMLDESKTELRHNPRPYYEAYIHAGEDDNHKHFEKDIPYLGRVHFYAYLNPNANDRIIYMRGLRMFVYRKKSQTNAAFYGLFLCYDPHGNLVLRDMEPPRHDSWDAEWARKYSKDDCRNAKDAYTNFIVECIKQLHPEDSEDGVDVLGADEVYVPESLIDEDDKTGAGSSQGQAGSAGTPSGDFQQDGTSMTTDIDNPIPDIDRPDTGGTGKIRRINDGWEVDKDGKNRVRVRPRNPNKRKGRGRGSQPGTHETSGTRTDSDQSLKVYVDATCRPVFTKIDGILYHDLIIRPEEDIENGELELIVGGEQDTIDIPIIFASEGAINGNHITGVSLKADQKNVIRIRFEDNLRHSINLSAYECK